MKISKLAFAFSLVLAQLQHSTTMADSFCSKVSPTDEENCRKAVETTGIAGAIVAFLGTWAEATMNIAESEYKLSYPLGPAANVKLGELIKSKRLKPVPPGMDFYVRVKGSFQEQKVTPKNGESLSQALKRITTGQTVEEISTRFKGTVRVFGAPAAGVGLATLIAALKMLEEQHSSTNNQSPDLPDILPDGAPAAQ